MLGRSHVDFGKCLLCSRSHIVRMPSEVNNDYILNDSDNTDDDSDFCIENNFYQILFIYNFLYRKFE